MKKLIIKIFTPIVIGVITQEKNKIKSILQKKNQGDVEVLSERIANAISKRLIIFKRLSQKRDSLFFCFFSGC